MESIESFDQPSMVVGTLGHVAHGKSTTVKWLTGTKPTRHSKEKIRGITIELGYSACKLYSDKEGRRFAARGADGPPSLTLPDGTLVTCKRFISFADCPGHDELMAVMLGGATVMDAALLTVAADDRCPMPQTEEHLVAAEMMGLENMILVQNKLDLVDLDDAWAHRDALRQFVAKTTAENAPLVPVSASLGINMEILIRLLLELPQPNIAAKASLPLKASIVRSFDINKPGAPMATHLMGGVVGGTIVEGTVTVGDRVDILPGEKLDDGTWRPLSTTILSMKSEKTSLTRSFPGGLIGFCTSLDPAVAGSNGLIGQWMVAPGTLRDAVITKGRFRFHCLKRAVTGKRCKIHRRDTLEINVGARSLTADFTRTSTKDVYDLVFSEPILVEPSTRLVASRERRIMGIGYCEETK